MTSTTNGKPGTFFPSTSTCGACVKLRCHSISVSDGLNRKEGSRVDRTTSVQGEWKDGMRGVSDGVTKGRINSKVDVLISTNPNLNPIHPLGPAENDNLSYTQRSVYEKRLRRHRIV